MNRRLILSIIFLTIALDFFNLGLIFPIFSALIFEGNGGLVPVDASEFYKNSLFGIMMAAFPMGQFFGAPVLGRLSDSYCRRTLLMLSLVGAVATAISCAAGIALESISLLLIGRFLGGLMAGNMTLAYASLAEISPPEEKVRNFSLIPLATGVGFAMGPYIAALLIEEYSLGMPFIVAGVLSLINLILVAWKFPASTGLKNKQPLLDGFIAGLTNITKMVRPNPLRPYFFILFMTISANFVFVQFLGPLVIEKFDFSIIDLGYLYANMGISVCLGHLLVNRRLSKYLSVEKALRGSLVFLAVLLVAIVFVSSFVLIHAFTAMIMFAFAVSYTNAMTLVSNKASKDEQGETMGIAISVQSLSEFLPAAVLGLVAAFFLGLPILAAALMTIVGGTLLSCMNRRPEYLHRGGG